MEDVLQNSSQIFKRTTSLIFGPNAVSNKNTPVTIAYFDRPLVQSPIRMDCKLYDTLQADTIFTTKIVRLY